MARIFALHLPFYDAKSTSKVECQQPLERDREILRQLKQSLKYGNDDVLDLSCETIILEAIYTKYCQLYPNV